MFDVGGGIKLHGTLTIGRSKLTIAGQTAPGGITLWGYPLQVDGASDVIIRFIRVRTGDFNARAPKGNDSLHGKGAMDLNASSANGIGVIRSSRIILDHVSTAWGMDETLSVTHSRDVTVQHSIIAEVFGPIVPSQRSARLWIADSRRNYARRSRQGRRWVHAVRKSVGTESSAQPIRGRSADAQTGPKRIATPPSGREHRQQRDLWLERPADSSERFRPNKAQFCGKLFRQRTRE